MCLLYLFVEVSVFISVRVQNRNDVYIDVLKYVAIAGVFRELLNGVQCSGRGYPLARVNTGIDEQRWTKGLVVGRELDTDDVTTFVTFADADRL